ncbi:MAG: SpoIIE family protein phosphatase [Phycisphaeraceae bacterium]|nr:SpoIIE family protein phosphatase [Phycisphaeraceae bacterium]
MNDAPLSPVSADDLDDEIQRELSRLRNPADLVRTFVSALSRAMPASRLLYVLPWPPPVRRYAWIPGAEVAAGSLGFRVLLDVNAGDPDQRVRADFATLFAPRGGFDADASGGLIGWVIAQQRRVMLNELAIDPADPVLRAAAGVHKALLAVPIYWQGHVQAWILVFADRPAAFRDEDARFLMATGNMLARSAVYLDTLEEARLANARLRATFEEIGRVQRLLLPASLPADPRLSFATGYMPSEAAGGDYYDLHEPDPDTLDLVIADVSGHGPVASVAMAMLRTAMQSWCRGGHAPATVVPQINELMHTSLDEGMFITACFLNLDRRTGVLNYVNCGHNPPMLRRRGGGVELLNAGGGPPLGVSKDLNPPAASITLAPGDLLVLYTDGISEAFSPRNELFGLPNLAAAIDRGEGDPERTRRSVLEAVDRHAAGRPRVDDQTLVVMGYRGG